MNKRHDELVASQFGSQANAYVTSAVHATEPDLQELERLAASSKFDNAIDIGCGGGHVTYALAPHVARVTAFDVSEEMLSAVARTARERGFDNVTLRQGDVERIPCGDDSFDLAASRFSAHHWQNLYRSLSEVKRVLRPGGRAVFIDVISTGTPAQDTFLQTLELLRDPSHVRDYSLGEWIEALRASGFRVLKSDIRSLRLEFSSWVARMRTPEKHIEAIRSLQNMASDGIAARFALSADGSFTVATAVIDALTEG